MKRLLDIIASVSGLIILSPFLLLISLIVKLDSKGPVFYRQIRVGKDAKEFGLYKFRSMRTGSDKKGLLTVGSKDNRITKSGYFLRKYKLDELPQLLNVFFGEMSLVGPRPEVPKYVNMYDQEQRKVLEVRPGITDYASLTYFDESDLLAASGDPERTYIEEVMPAKLQINLDYLKKRSLLKDIGVIFLTFKRIIIR